MGQYHLTVNLDKREFIDPHKLGSGLKLWEQLAANVGPGKALIVLLAHPDRRGGGDFDVTENWHGPERKDMTKVGPMPTDYPAIAARTIGRWRGDRIAIIGDYAEDGDLKRHKDDPKTSEIYGLCRGRDEQGEGVPFTDITDDVCAVIAHELRGAFIGAGWRHFFREGQKVSRWKDQNMGNREKIEGEIRSISDGSITVAWPSGPATYTHENAPYLMEA